MKHLVIRIINGTFETLANAGIAMIGPIDWDLGRSSGSANDGTTEPPALNLDSDDVARVATPRAES
jgi:hypothetical protein